MTHWTDPDPGDVTPDGQVPYRVLDQVCTALDGLQAARELVDLCEGMMSLAYVRRHAGPDGEECICCACARPLHDASCPYADAVRRITGAEPGTVTA